jgi:nucleoside-diphosphate-sugar epimerase
MVRVLVTGASGFVGSAIAQGCQEAGLDVRCTGRSNTIPQCLVNYCPADLLDADALPALVAGVEAIVHAAGLAHQFGQANRAKDRFTAVNVCTTENVIRAAIRQGVRHIVLVSSVSVYGPHTGSPRSHAPAWERSVPTPERGNEGVTEEHLCCPQEPYSQSKYEAEQRSVELAKGFGLKLTILRLATVYGEEDPGNVARLIRVIDRGRFAWVGTGTNLKSLIHRDDVARACITVLRQPPAGVNIFNLSGPTCPMRQIVDTLAAALDRRLPRWHVPASLALGLTRLAGALGGKNSFLLRPYAALRKWLAEDAYDSAKFNQMFAFQTQIPLAEGLRREVMWYQSQTQERR